MNFLTSLFNKKYYYFDNNATTLIYNDDVKNEVNKWLSCGNPSNTLHFLGIDAHNQLNKCREEIAKDLNVNPHEVYFTGSATEANNIIIQGIINQNIKKPNQFKKYTIITSEFEHPSVLNVFKSYLNNDLINVVFIPIETDINNKYYGSVNPETLKTILYQNQNIILVSIMLANNETGAINDIKTIGQIIKLRDENIFFHCDCTQAIGKYIIHPKSLNIDSITFSGHKFHAPKGVGCLYIKNEKNKCELTCGLCFGGEQEETIRPGTENLAFISGLAIALKDVHENRKEKNKMILDNKNYLMSEFKKMGCSFINPRHSLCNTIMLILPLLIICNRQFCEIISKNYNVCIGTSSACQTGSISHVLKAMKINDKDKTRIIRISLCDYTTFEECQYLVNAFKDMINKYKKVESTY